MFLYKYRANYFIGGVYLDNTFLSGVKELSFGSFLRDLLKLIEYLLLFVLLGKGYVLLSKLGKSYRSIYYS
jgi:hypothetical protein